jgi:hypothetical protein
MPEVTINAPQTALILHIIVAIKQFRVVGRGTPPLPQHLSRLMVADNRSWPF